MALDLTFFRSALGGLRRAIARSFHAIAVTFADDAGKLLHEGRLRA